MRPYAAAGGIAGGAEPHDSPPPVGGGLDFGNDDANYGGGDGLDDILPLERSPSQQATAFPAAAAGRKAPATDSSVERCSPFPPFCPLLPSRLVAVL